MLTEKPEFYQRTKFSLFHFLSEIQPERDRVEVRGPEIVKSLIFRAVSAHTSRHRSRFQPSPRASCRSRDWWDAARHIESTSPRAGTRALRPLRRTSHSPGFAGRAVAHELAVVAEGKTADDVDLPCGAARIEERPCSRKHTCAENADRAHRPSGQVRVPSPVYSRETPLRPVLPMSCSQTAPNARE